MTTLLPAVGYLADVAAVGLLRAEREAEADPENPAQATEVLTLRHREAMLTGARPDDLLALGADVDRAVERFPTWPDLRLLRAALALAVHRPDVAAEALDAVPGLTESPPGRVLAADVDQFAGDYAGARAGYRQAAQEEPLWDTTARLAALAATTGADAEADALYVAAEDDLTAKQMRAFAWVRVQRAELARSLGDLDRAAVLLADADRAYPGWWYVTAHAAGLALAAGRPDRAVAGYRSVLAEVDRPDFHEALGTALLATGAADAAAAARVAALTAYLASVARGEVHYIHHLAACHVAVHPSAAVAWAREDSGLRRNGTTLSLLAWCLYRADRRDDALVVLDEAFALGAGDALLRHRAREIREGST